MLLTTLIANAQIPIEGLAVDHEGIVCWDADGSGPEPAATGHYHPFGVGSSLYYGASRDYDDIDPDPDAAMCHFLDNIEGFPLFEQALTDNGFTPGQVKVKIGLCTMKDDIEGEDWFTFNNVHSYNRYEAYYHIELNGELMISGNINYTYISSFGSYWQFESSFTLPFDASENSSSEVQDVAGAFIDDMLGEELRFVIDNLPATITFSDSNGRDGAYFEIVSGYLEKGLPELPYIGLAVDHEGLAAWDAYGTGPEPEAYGHTFYYGGSEWWMAYYIASCEYDAIDPDTNAALCHFIDDATGFPNLEIQLAYRGYTMEQLKLKSGIATLGNDKQGVDWDLDDSIHWYNFYGNTATFEIAGEPILQFVIDTNSTFNDLDNMDDDWWSYSTYGKLVDISAKASGDAQYVAASFLKDLGGHSIKSYMEGHYIEEDFFGNGRNGVFHEISTGSIIAGYPDTTTQAKSVYWWNDWSRCTENPVVEGEGGTWKDGIVFPTVLKDDGQYKMWFSGITSAWKGQVGYATSDNGLIWTVNNEPIIPFGEAGSWDYLRGPGKVLRINDTLKFWYTGFDDQFDIASIGYAWSLDGFDWNVRQNPVLGKGSPGTWNQNYVAEPVVYYDGEMYHLYFNTHDDIRYATSTDGISWDLYESNPVMLRGPNGSFYDYLIETGGLFVNNDTVHMLFTGMDGSFSDPDSRMRLGYAWSTDYKNWTIGNNGEPVFDVGQAGSWDEKGVRFASILTNTILGENKYMMWYGGNADNFAIGLACSDTCLGVGVLEFNRKTPIPVAAFPNPFTNEVSISFEITNKAIVSLEIYNLKGQLISVLVNENKPQGKHKVTFNAKHLPGGIYFCVLKTESGIQTLKMIKLK